MENNLVLYESIYQTSIVELNSLRKQLKEEQIELEQILEREIQTDFQDSPSNMDVYDYMFAVFFGIAGAMFSTNAQIEGFMDQIHKHASGKEKQESNWFQAFLGDLLQHEGHAIDLPSGASNFINRNGDNSYGLFHRLLWGHDILSLKGDNPFLLMIKQNGLIQGIVKTFQHLVADTFSKQALPIPGSSYLDYTSEKGKTSNYLLKVVQDIAKQNGDGSLAQDYYRHMFTIRAQDVAGQGLVFAAGQAYLYARGIKDKIRQTQYKVVSYTVNFLAHALIGSIKQGGVPYINWPALGMVMKEVATLFIKSNKETKRLANITKYLVEQNNYLIEKNDALEKKVLATGMHLKSYDNAEDYIEDYMTEENSSLDLIDLFEED